MPKAELSELLFIAMMFIVVTIISVVSIYLFIKQYKKEKLSSQEVKSEKLKGKKEE